MGNFRKNQTFSNIKTFLFQWLPRPLGSFELEIFGKLKNWIILGFYEKFTSDTLKNFKKMTLSNSRRVHSSITCTFPGFIRSKYILKTQKLSFFWFFSVHFRHLEKFRKIKHCMFSEVFICRWLARPLSSFELDISWANLFLENKLWMPFCTFWIVCFE